LEERSGASPGGFDGALAGLAHEVLELGEDLLDRIEIGTVGRQEDEPGAGGADGVAHRLSLMTAKIVEDHDVARRQGGSQQLDDISLEGDAVDR